MKIDNTSLIYNFESYTVDELLGSPHANRLKHSDILPLLKPGRSLGVLPASLEGSKYFRISKMMQEGEINSGASELHYQRHIFRMKNLLATATGFVLDVGCGDPRIGAGLLNEACSYVGLDPFPVGSDKTHRFMGAAEDLPFIDSCMDTVVFNTSLDHILDYVTALDEAHRVLKAGGRICIATLIWLDDYSLIRDEVHFHHFKTFQIEGALEHSNFKLINVRCYPYKSDTHRFGAYLEALAQ